MAARDNIENGQCRARIFNRILLSAHYGRSQVPPGVSQDMKKSWNGGSVHHSKKKS
jgi:hypothetical protein